MFPEKQQEEIMIESYSFGEIKINGKTFNSDLVIYGNNIEKNWWRKEGHVLNIADIEPFINKFRPETIIVGTGKNGMMRIPAETKKYIEDMGIEFISQNSDNACDTYNRLIESGKVMAALHLTC